MLLRSLMFIEKTETSNENTSIMINKQFDNWRSWKKKKNYKNKILINLIYVKDTIDKLKLLLSQIKKNIFSVKIFYRNG